VKVKCEECHGYGGLRYEPGLLTYICNKCQGKGEVETAEAPPKKLPREYVLVLAPEMGIVVLDSILPGRVESRGIMEADLPLLEGRTFQAHPKPDGRLLLVEVMLDPSLKRCPVCVKGERCGREVGHDGKHMWGRGD
jgi:hypothetical protein